MASIIQFKCQYKEQRVKNVDDEIGSKSLTEMSRDNRTENDDINVESENE